MRFTATSRIPVPAQELYDWHLRGGAFRRLSPPWDVARTVRCDRPLRDGAVREVAVSIGPFSVRWIARHDRFEPGLSFRDVQERGPFRAFRHTHRFEPVEGGRGARLVDEIEFEPPFSAGLPGVRAIAGIESRLARMFRFRHAVTAFDLERHERYRERPRLRVAVTGASGFLGRALCALLEGGGHTVSPVVRRAPREGEIGWDPARGTIEPSDWEGLDAVVHLAGENIAGGRWTTAVKRRIRDSRVGSTTLLAETLAGLERPPAAFVAASAVGFYGDRREPVDEDAAPGEGFLPRTCVEWEGALDAASRAGVRTVAVRIGAVLGAAGGALAKMRLPFSLGVGGPVGDGRQPFPWIGHHDVVGVLHDALFEPWSGPVNAVAPAADTSASFARALGATLRRPAFLPLPAFAVRALFGEMGRAVLLEGAPVVPARLRAAGFSFRHPRLEDVLAFELGRAPAPDVEIAFE